MRLCKFLLLLAITTSLLGCIRSSNLYLGDGSLGHEIDCDGQWVSIDSCFNKAAEICGSNEFETVTREGISTRRSVAKGSTDINSNAFSTRAILVRCHHDRVMPAY
jgi:hypothetical protein